MAPLLHALAAATAAAALSVLAVAQPSGCRSTRSESADISGAAYGLAGTACAVHDPAVAAEGGQLYVFSTDTGPQAGFNGNLLIRTASGPGNGTLAVTSQIFASLEAIPWYNSYAPGATGIWAPDASYFAGAWHVYYAVSEFGTRNSVIGLATRSTLDAGSAEPWRDGGPVLATNGSQGFNAIDPSIVLDASTGAVWMVLGSFWEGIQVVPVDAATGLVAGPPTNIANRQMATDAIEGAFLVRRAADGMFYLFVSWNFCCRGAASNYEVRVGRARNATGPFLDEAGVSMLAGGGTHLAGGGHGWAAAGGESVLRETVDEDVTLFVVHAYDGVSGDPWLQVVGLQWDAVTGWPSLVPYPAGREGGTQRPAAY
jgi:arabinan endo-1,5-alpha-L-arabinosidase